SQIALSRKEWLSLRFFCFHVRGVARLSIPEHHVARFLAAPCALFTIQSQIIRHYIVPLGEADLSRGLIDRRRRPLKLNEGPYRRLVNFDQQPMRPFLRGGQTIGCPELFVSEPATQSYAFKDSG